MDKWIDEFKNYNETFYLIKFYKIIIYFYILSYLFIKV